MTAADLAAANGHSGLAAFLGESLLSELLANLKIENRRLDCASCAQSSAKQHIQCTCDILLKYAACFVSCSMACLTSPRALAAAVMAAAAGTGSDQSPSHRKRSRAQRSFTAEDAQVRAPPPMSALMQRHRFHEHKHLAAAALYTCSL